MYIHRNIFPLFLFYFFIYLYLRKLFTASKFLYFKILIFQVYLLIIPNGIKFLIYLFKGIFALLQQKNIKNV